MITFKQMEAVYWIVQLGSFEAAASKLNAGQSAISKRIQELERTFDFAVFDRSHRSARLTEKGNELFECAKELLQRRDQIVERVSAKEVLVRRVRIGVTELTALTWLPSLILEIKREYPKVDVEAEVDLSPALRSRFAEDVIDLIVVPEILAGERPEAMVIGRVEHEWMCAPTVAPSKRQILLTELGPFPLILQGTASGTGLAFIRFLQENGVNTTRILTANNLVAQIGLTVSGLGISYLPKRSLDYLVTAGILTIVKTKPALPVVRYMALFRPEQTLSREIAQLASRCCNFESTLLEPPRPHTS